MEKQMYNIITNPDISAIEYLEDINSHFTKCLNVTPTLTLNELLTIPVPNEYQTHITEIQRAVESLKINTLVGMGARITQAVVNDYQESLHPIASTLELFIAIATDGVCDDGAQPPDVMLTFYVKNVPRSVNAVLQHRVTEDVLVQVDDTVPTAYHKHFDFNAAMIAPIHTFISTLPSTHVTSVRGLVDMYESTYLCNTYALIGCGKISMNVVIANRRNVPETPVAHTVPNHYRIEFDAVSVEHTGEVVQ